MQKDVESGTESLHDFTPCCASGGFVKLQDSIDAVQKGGASVLSVGSMFVFQVKYKAVLISYPSMEELKL